MRRGRDGELEMTVSLSEFDMVEWWDICRKVRPELGWEEYEAMWSEFAEMKRLKGIQ